MRLWWFGLEVAQFDFAIFELEVAQFLKPNLRSATVWERNTYPDPHVLQPSPPGHRPAPWLTPWNLSVSILEFRFSAEDVEVIFLGAVVLATL